MKVYSCASLLFFVFKNVVLCNEESRNEDINIKSIFMPLVYLQKLNNSNKKYIFQVPVIFVPVIILPLNQKQNVSQFDDDLIENAFGINGTRRNTTLSSSLNNSEFENGDIEVSFRQSLNRGEKFPKKVENKTDDDLSISDDDSSNNTNIIENNAKGINITIGDAPDNKTKMQDADESQIISNSNLYPVPNDESKLVDSLPLTTTIHEEMNLPAVGDKRWKNFIMSTNNVTNKTSTSNNFTSSSTETNRIKGHYSAALYNNAMIDQISITTNSYTNIESSTARNDRWVRFSSLEGQAFKPTGFKPLAGLYYDGFLHTPLIKMPGFKPHADY